MYLTGLIFLPIFFILPLLFLKTEKSIKVTCLAFSVIHFLYSCFLFMEFDKADAAFQMVESVNIIPSLGIKYSLGIDGISFWLVLLTTFLLPLIILGAWNSIKKNLKTFYLSMFVLQTAMLGSFLSTDLLLFYMFFESSLIPMFLLIGIWGGARRQFATVKFFVYTMFGSIFMLGGIITLMILNKSVTGQLSAGIIDLSQLNISYIEGTLFSTQAILFLGFALAFAVKTPLFPLHTWLPDAHVEAPTPGSVVLAGVMLKMGTYGFMRFCLPLFPEAIASMGWILCVLAILGIIYGAMVALVQTDIKKLVAYSSVSHMGYVVLGIFCLNEIAQVGAVYQMLNHGISTGALFLMVGMLYERTHDRKISSYSGLATQMPIFTILFLIVTLSSIAVPLTNGFIGEFLILNGAFQENMYYGIFGVVGVVLGAAYMLWMVKRVFYGQEKFAFSTDLLKDLNLREIFVLTPLVILIFWMGVFPNHFLQYTNESVKYLNSQVQTQTIDIADKAIKNDR